MYGCFRYIDEKKGGLNKVDIKEKAYSAAKELIELAHLKEGQLLVVGCSTSEVLGKKLGTYSNPEVGRELFEGIYRAAAEVHNRVETITSCAAKLQSMLPEARIAVAHGQMNQEEMSDIWEQLVEHEIDILVCTTIIETGVDVPNVNTLIIEDADRFGLSQLYQLRGRVGRSNRRGYAFFTYKRDKVLTEIASKRLSAMREFTQFGSGFRIALRDLEIRGAGSILGGSQHGHMEAVGYDM